MAASAILGFALVAIDLNKLGQLGVIAPIIAGVFALMSRLIDNAGASRRQKRELRSRNGQSTINGFVIAIVLVCVGAAVYFYNHPRNDGGVTQAQSPPTVPTTLAPIAGPTLAPTIAPTALPIAQPITFDEASSFVAAFVDNLRHPETHDRAWAMYSEAHANFLTREHGGIEGFKAFWQRVDTIESPDEPSVLTESTADRAVLVVPLNYLLFPNSDGFRKCTIEHDTFVLIRVSGTLLIDDYNADAVDCPATP